MISFLLIFRFLFAVCFFNHDDSDGKGIAYISSSGTDQSEIIEALLSDKNVVTLVLQDSGIIVNKTITIPRNKVLQFEPGASLTGMGTLHGGLIRAAYHQAIFGATLTVNPQEKDSIFSVKWYGAKGDGLTNDREAIRKTFDMTKRMGGGNVFLPGGTYLVSRREKAPRTIIEIFSNTKVRGEGMDKTTLKLDPNDMLNFRRILLLGSKSEVTENIDISELAFDMSNPFKTYPPPASFGHDAQSAAIFCYSDSFDVRNIYLHNLLIENVTGDVIGVSTNSKNITIERIYQRNYLRQGISIGGTGGVDSITVKHIFDLPFTDGVVKGGNSIHTEPYAVVTNVSYSQCNILDFSASGIDGLLIDSMVTTSDSLNICNNVSNFLIRNNIFNSKLQVAPTGKGVIEKNMLHKGLFITSVGKGGFRDLSGIDIRNNTVIDTSATFTNIRVSQVNGVSVYDNEVSVNGDAIVIANGKSGRILNNRVHVENPKYFGVYVYSTIKDRYGEGPYEIDGNVISGNNRGIRADRVAATIGAKNMVNK